MIGVGVTRREDARILLGKTCYVDDIERRGLAHVAFVRSPHAHASLLAIDPPAGPDVPDGLLAVLTASELDGLVRPFPVPPLDGAFLAPVPHPILARDEVCYVGQPVAAVISATRALAEDAAERVQVRYEPLPAVVNPRDSTIELMRWTRAGGDVEAAFAAARHVVRGSYALPRVIAAPIETRGCVVEHDAAKDLLTVWCSAQDPHRPRAQLAHILGRPDDRIRVIVPDVGGAFGSKGVIGAEIATVAAAACKLGLPLKWSEDRLENFLAAYQGRGIDADLELALDVDGRMLAIRARLSADLGAYLYPTTAIPPHTAATLITGCYDIRSAEVTVVGARTHKVPTGPYRGAGRPDAAYLLERLVDDAAAELGIDRIELRRRNLIARFPHRTPLGLEYDSGAYEQCLDLVLRLRGSAPATSASTVIGTGVAMYVERAGGQWEAARIELQRGGRFEIATSACAHGQGHETTFAQIAAARLGTDLDQIAIRFGDSATTPRGVGTFGSRSVAMAGSAIVCTVDKLIELARPLAAGLLETESTEVSFAQGMFATGRSQVSWGEVADVAQQGALSASASFESPPVFSSGAYAAVVEIERATGSLRVLRLAGVDDSGTVINPLLAHGQVVGGAVQGLGECLVEEAVHDSDGQNRSRSFMDYSLLTAADVPPIVTGEVASPSPLNPLGAKGAGEGGTVGAVPAVANAVADALGGRNVDPPYTAEKLWHALHGAGR